MYEKFFGLNESPFRINPDPRYAFLTLSAREALAGMTYGIQTRKGIILLTGEAGTGKTTELVAQLTQPVLDRGLAMIL